MHSFGRDQAFVTEGIPEDAIVCFCWGEIDCRAHINKFPPYQDTIDRLVERYLEAIKINWRPVRNVWIYNVVPPARTRFEWEGQMIDTPQNLSVPFVGTDEERLSYVRYMNKKLRESGYTFVDIYDKYCDKDGYLLTDNVASDFIHIMNPEPLKDWVKNKLEEIEKEGDI